MDNKYRLGLVSVSFRQHTPEEIVKAAKSAGLSCIEWGSDIHAPCKDSERLKEIVSLQEKYGIFCSSYGTYFRLGQNSLDELDDYINAAKMLGTRILRLWCGSESGKNMTAEERERLFSECRRAAEIAENNDVILCMECHCGTFTENPEDTEILMKTVNSPCFRMYWQPFQWLDTDGSMAAAEITAPYTEHIHVFNWKGAERFSLNDGIDDWHRYLTAFPAPRTLLLEFMPDDNIETLPVEAEALKVITGESI